MSGSEIEIGMLMQSMSNVESEARELCRLALTTHPELRPFTRRLEEAIREVDRNPALVKARAALNG
jgi:hypothetical protein